MRVRYSLRNQFILLFLLWLHISVAFALPSLGTGRMIDGAGQFSTTTTTFTGGAALNGVNHQANVTVNPDAVVNLQGSIQISPSDVGKQADLLVVVGVEPSEPFDGGVDTVYRTIDEFGERSTVDLYNAPTVWMNQLADHPFKRSVSLTSDLPVDIGALGSNVDKNVNYVFVGYRLADGSVIYSSQPIIFNVLGSFMETKILYTMPEESETHEGTWLQWPHQYQYGIAYRDSLDSTWVAITQTLVTSEKVHIIAYNEIEKKRIISLLNSAKVPLTNVDFKIYKTDDVWVRDNGPIYVRDNNGNLVIQDWGFNGWGQKIDDLSKRHIQFENCNTIPVKIGVDQNRTVIDINSIMINEGGSVEIDGHGTLMACKSSILNSNRNPDMTQAQAESIFKKYLGITHFIWLDGRAGLELTDQHIDGFARFGNATTIVTMEQNDLLDFDVKQSDIDKLYAAKNKNGTAYTFVKVPLTQNNVKKTDGTNLGYKGSYVNYYIANNKILVPNYNDPNDAVANNIIQGLYPTRTVVGIDVRNLYENGGMIHCVTQQQPAK